MKNYFQSMFSCNKTGGDLKKFTGVYYGTQLFPNGIKEAGSLVISLVGNERINTERIKTETHNFSTGDKKTIVYSPNDETCFISRNGSLVDEYVSKDLFDNDTKSAVVFTVSKDDKMLTKCVYKEYKFKGLFGGYWFARDVFCQKFCRVSK